MTTTNTDHHELPAWAVEFAHAEPGHAPMPEMFRIALREAGVGVLLAAASGRVLSSNPEAWRLTGCHEADLLGRPIADLLHCPDHTSPLDITHLISTHHRARVDVLVRRPDDTRQPCELTISAFDDDTSSSRFALCVLHDTTEFEERLARTRQTLRGVVDSLMDPWVLLAPVRADGRITDFMYVDANDAAAAHNKTSRNQLVGQRLNNILPEHWRTGLFDAYVDVIATGDPLGLDEHPFSSELTTGTETRWYDNRATRVGDLLSLTWRDVTDRVTLRQRLTVSATTDHATGLLNRTALLATASETDAPDTGPERRGVTGERQAVLFIDLDGLKHVNDTLGHSWGDRLIEAVAHQLSAQVRETDLVARIGGDEFAILATGLRDHNDLDGLVNKCLTAAATPITIGPHRVTPSVRIGTAWRESGEPFQQTLDRADNELYARKRNRLPHERSRIENHPVMHWHQAAAPANNPGSIGDSAL